MGGNAMSSDNDLEDLLTRTPGPRVVAGAHRADLKARLLQSMPKERPVKTTRKRLLVACCVVGCIAILLAAGGWTANQVYTRSFVVEESQGEVTTVVNPDGSVMSTSTSRSVSVGSNDPEFTEGEAQRRWAPMKQAIEQGNYTLVKQEEIEPGLTVYTYRVVLEDGSTRSFATNKPLDEPEEDPHRRLERIRQAIDQGKYTLVKEEEIEPELTVYTYHVVLEDGSTRSYATNKRLPEPNDE
jgi:anti-sigma28 factor (negative regulator of flagellin synthesis)